MRLVPIVICTLQMSRPMAYVFRARKLPSFLEDSCQPKPLPGRPWPLGGMGLWLQASGSSLGLGRPALIATRRRRISGSLLADLLVPGLGVALRRVSNDLRGVGRIKG